MSALAFTLVQTFEADSDRFDASEFMDATQLPEAGWPVWADTPAKRERNQRSWAAHNERVRASQDTADGDPIGEYPASGSMLHTLSAEDDPTGEGDE